jgi:hypothetical protein
MRAGSDPYNRLYERMIGFHTNFRASYAFLQRFLPQSASLSKRDLEVYLSRAADLCHHLEMHHSIEVSGLSFAMSCATLYILAVILT